MYLIDENNLRTIRGKYPPKNRVKNFRNLGIKHSSIILAHGRRYLPGNVCHTSLTWDAPHHYHTSLKTWLGENNVLRATRWATPTAWETRWPHPTPKPSLKKYVVVELSMSNASMRRSTVQPHLKADNNKLICMGQKMCEAESPHLNPNVGKTIARAKHDDESHCTTPSRPEIQRIQCFIIW